MGLPVPIASPGPRRRWADYGQHTLARPTDQGFAGQGDRLLGYMKKDQSVMIDGNANWRARDFMACDAVWMMEKDANGRYKGAAPRELNKVGAATDWENYKNDDGDYRAEVNLAPGFALTNTRDAAPDAWFSPGSKTAPAHFCSDHVDTRNSPGPGLVLGCHEEYAARRLVRWIAKNRGRVMVIRPLLR